MPPKKTSVDKPSTKSKRGTKVNNSTSPDDNTPNTPATRTKSAKESSKNKSGNNNGKLKANNKRDKLSYNGINGMNIIEEFSERNRDIIVKFPPINPDSNANELPNIVGGNLEYNPNIIEPLPMIDSMQRVVIGQSVSSDINNMMMASNNINIDDIQQQIYDNYITAGSNINLNVQNIVSMYQTMLQHNMQNTPTYMANNTQNIFLSTPVSSCLSGGKSITENNEKIDSLSANDNNNIMNSRDMSTNNYYVENIGEQGDSKQTTVVTNLHKYQRKIDDLLSEFASPEKKRAMTQIEILLHKKYSQTKQIEMMYAMCQYVNTGNEWPKTCSTACLWDCHKFPYMPWGIPESYDMKTGKFSLSGVFCSPNCALAYLMDTEKNTSVMWEKISLLNLLYHKVYKGSDIVNMDNLSKVDDNVSGSDYAESLKGLTQLEIRNRKKMAAHKAKMENQFTSIKWGTEDIVPAPDRMTLNMFGGPLTIEQYRCLTINNDKNYKIVHPPCNFVAPVLEESKKVFTQDNNFIPVDTNYILRIENKLKMKRTMPVAAPKIKL